MSLAQAACREAERQQFTPEGSEAARGQEFRQCFLEDGLLATTWLLPDSQTPTPELDPTTTREWPGSCHRTPRRACWRLGPQQEVQILGKNSHRCFHPLHSEWQTDKLSFVRSKVSFHRPEIHVKTLPPSNRLNPANSF